MHRKPPVKGALRWWLSCRSLAADRMRRGEWMCPRSGIWTQHRGRRRHKRWPKALKRGIVAATLMPGASAPVVAQAYDGNSNQVLSWRWRLDGTVKAPPSPSSGRSPPQLVPVTMTTEQESEGAGLTPPSPAAETIEIEAGTYCVRMGAGFDSGALKGVLDVLGRGACTRERSR